VLTVIMFWWAIAAVSTGAAAGLILTLLSARFLLGLGEAGAFPVATRGMQLWFPKVERGRIQGITHCFSRFAVAVTPFVAVGIMSAFGWRAIFYIFGSLGAIWAAVFGVIYLNRPEDHKGVNRSELARIRGLNARRVDPAARRRETAQYFLEINPSLAEYVVHRRGVRLLFLRNLFLPHLVSDLPPGIPALLAEVAGLRGLASSFCRNDRRPGGRIDKRSRVPQDGYLKLARRVVAVPGLLISGAMLIPTALTHSAWTAVTCLAISFFLPGTRDRSGVGRADGCGGRVQRHGKQRDEHRGSSGGVGIARRLRLFRAAGILDHPVHRHGRVLLGGALIWTFLINPELSVVGENPS
jgi:MFS family permease